MPLLKGQILKELVLTSKYNCAINGSSLEFVLPENINFGDQTVYVGVKNFKMPKVKKEITLKLYFGHIFDKYTEAKIKQYNLKYESFEDLCLQIQCCALEHVGIGKNMDINFRTPNEVHDKVFFIDVSYNGERIVIKIDADYVLIVSENFGSLIEKGQIEKKNSEVSDDVFYFLDGVMYISKKMLFEKPEDRVVHLMVHDIVESCTVLSNGFHLPLLYTYKKGMALNEIDVIRLVSVKYFRCLKITFMNGNFERYSFDDYDLENDDISFSLIFFD